MTRRRSSRWWRLFAATFTLFDWLDPSRPDRVSLRTTLQPDSVCGLVCNRVLLDRVFRGDTKPTALTHFHHSIGVGCGQVISTFPLGPWNLLLGQPAKLAKRAELGNMRAAAG